LGVYILGLDLQYELKRRKKRFVASALCSGGREGIAVVYKFQNKMKYLPIRRYTREFLSDGYSRCLINNYGTDRFSLLHL